jgi:hypothetical protein
MARSQPIRYPISTHEEYLTTLRVRVTIAFYPDKLARCSAPYPSLELEELLTSRPRYPALQRSAEQSLAQRQKQQNV